MNSLGSKLLVTAMFSSIYQESSLLAARLLQLTNINPELALEWDDTGFDVVASPRAPTKADIPVQVIVTLNEINDQHGTGPLVQRIFAGRAGVFSIRSRNDWKTQTFGDWSVRLSQRGLSRPEAFRRVLRPLRGRKVQSVTCVPFLSEELLTSLAIRRVFDAKLCAYLMDDQNIAVNNIPDSLMSEFLGECNLRLATHPELRDAYQQKYGLPFYLLPAVVPAALIADSVVHPREEMVNRPALLGSFWDQSWFDRLCDALERSPYQVDWYGQNRSPWVEFSDESLSRARITAHGIVPEEQLAKQLRKHPFVIVPGGALDEKETNRGVASLSLPGRIPFAMATANVPILFVGSNRSCGARFVDKFDIGLRAPYEAGPLLAAMDRMLDPDLQERMRRNAAAISRSLSDAGISQWLAEGTLQGAPADRRFEDLFSIYESSLCLPAEAPEPTHQIDFTF